MNITVLWHYFPIFLSIYRCTAKFKRRQIVICIIFFHILTQQTFKILNLFWNILKNSLFHFKSDFFTFGNVFNRFEIFMTVSMTTALFLMTRSTLTLALTSEMYGPSTRNTLADSAGQHGNNGQLCCSELQQQEISIE